MKISFIIPAYNEESLLPATLSALNEVGAELGLDYEIVVADDASDDATGEIAREHGAVVVRGENRQISKTRNLGAGVANGDVFVFVDADTVVPVEVVRETVKAFEAGAVGGGARVGFDGTVPFWARVMFGPFELLYTRVVRWAAGCYIFCTREAFDAVGGFEEDLFVAEEKYMSLSLRKQGRFVIVNEAVITSGRKLRTYSARDVLGAMVDVSFCGKRGYRKREKFDLWYGERREDRSGKANF